MFGLITLFFQILNWIEGMLPPEPVSVNGRAGMHRHFSQVIADQTSSNPPVSAQLLQQNEPGERLVLLLDHLKAQGFHASSQQRIALHTAMLIAPPLRTMSELLTAMRSKEHLCLYLRTSDMDLPTRQLLGHTIARIDSREYISLLVALQHLANTSPTGPNRTAAKQGHPQLAAA